ncbi:MAG: hypothetical protein HPY74_06110 [Firmicutes bacterium]|nr:hypothetical protein [Bacillota bacterium]
MDNAAVIKNKVDELAKWSKLYSDCKAEIEKLKGELGQVGLDEMRNKKIKQVEFWGNDKAKAVVTQSEMLNVQFPEILKHTLGDIIKDHMSEEIRYKYSKPFERILISVFQEAYVRQTLDSVIKEITDDAKIRAALGKKLKGNWKKDVETLKNIAGLSQTNAEYYAYFVQDAINYEKIVQLLKAAGYNPDTQSFEEALQAIGRAIVVEEGIKVGIEYSDGDGSN